MKTYKELLRITPKNNKILKIVVVMIIIIGLLLVNIKTYDHKNYFGINYNKVITLNVPINNSDTIINGTYLKINNKKHEYKIINISELKVENNVNYKEIQIKTDEKLLDNEVVEITFYSNKEILIKKILKIIF